MSFVSPFAEELTPFIEAEWSSERDFFYYISGRNWIVISIGKPHSFEHHVSPNGFCKIRDPQLLSVVVMVAKEGTEFVSVHLFSQKENQILVIFEVLWKLDHYLA